MLPGTTVFVASIENRTYDKPMAKAKKFDLEIPALVLDGKTRKPLRASRTRMRAGLCLRKRPVSTCSSEPENV